MNAKLLLIDTDAAIDEALAATLRLRGYDVIRMSSGAEALTALEHEEFEAVVTDIDMPGMTGFEFCRRAQTAWPHVPVVLVTASGSMETAVSAIRAGAYDFISKPIRTQELPKCREKEQREERCIKEREILEIKGEKETIKEMNSE